MESSMARYKSTLRANQDARRYPWVVDIPVPGTGLGKELDEMDAWCREAAGNAWARHSRTIKGVHIARTYFQTRGLAEAFQERFGGAFASNPEYRDAIKDDVE